VRSGQVVLQRTTWYGPHFGHCQHTESRLANLEKQTLKFNIDVRVKFKNRKKVRMSVWQAIEMLNTLVDDSDPDVSDADIDLAHIWR
jgi:hypothetical protein